jgi:hypothetical protein
MSGTTEDKILGTIPGIDDSSDVGDSTGGDTGDSGQAQTSAQPTQGAGGGQTSAQPTGQGGAGGTAQQPQQPIRRRHDGLVEVPNEENPNTRDLVDPITGRTVAKGGIERKVYEDGQRAARENNQLKTQLAGASRQLAAINQVTQEAVRLNVAPQDQIAAIRVMSDFMRDPVKTLEYLVAEVKAKGYQIPFLEQGVTPGMDMTAIGRMIDSKMQPLTQQQQAQQHEREQRSAAERDLNTFLEDNQEANQNLDVLAEMLNAQPGLPLQSAYTKLIRWAHENGLDWTQPLKPQIAGRRQQPTQQQATQQPGPQRPMPGRGVNPNTAAPVGNGVVQQHSENSSWSDIVRAAMQEQGVTLS